MNIRESNLYSLWAAVCSLYEESLLHRILKAAGGWCSRQIDDSFILEPLCREGVVARSWGGSLTCRVLTAAVNLPGWLLHRLYCAFQTAFDGSFFANLAFEMGAETAIAESWIILLLWVIPFSHWNNAYNLLGFLLLLALFYIRGMREEKARLDVRAAGFYSVVFFGAVCLAVPLSAYPSMSLRFLMYHVICVLCVLVTVSSVRCGEDLKRLAAGGGFVVLVSSAYGIYQRIQGVAVNKSYVDVTLNEGMPGRVESFFDNPNTFAEVLILLLPLLVALTLCAKHWYSKVAAGGIFLIGAAALGMTYSRASWVGIAVAAAVFVFLWKPKLIPAFIVLCVACVPLLPSTIWNRILTIANTSDSSTASRVPLYEAAVRVIRREPVSGAGLGTAAVQRYIADWNLYHAKAPYVHSHNIYLEVWVETGILGLAGFFASMLWNIKNAARQVRHSQDSAARTITAACAASLCGAMVAGLADYLWNYPRVMSMFWFVFALAIAGVKVCRGAVGAAADAAEPAPAEQ
ncbi:MAG: O-antigen ligase family protein [Oscillibacter sp.]|jgi:putative inorganic carbon (HCO3(-)) transporter|nr:O-antigen ligase family protein [Oscillibacter sp.]